MTNDGWGSKWPVVSWQEPIERGWPKSYTPVNVDVYEGKISLDTIKQLKSQGSNLVDHQEYLYFQCDGCQEILDPHTKSFRALQEFRISAGWKCVWNIDGMGYKVYCAECGEKM